MNVERYCCGNCIFYAENKDNHGDTGMCTRYPPKIFVFPKVGVIGSEPKLLIRHFRPIIGKNELCGEHQLRPSDENIN